MKHANPNALFPRVFAVKSFNCNMVIAFSTASQKSP
jgi:hypothetical protein